MSDKATYSQTPFVLATVHPKAQHIPILKHNRCAIIVQFQTKRFQGLEVIGITNGFNNMLYSGSGHDILICK